MVAIWMFMFLIVVAAAVLITIETNYNSARFAGSLLVGILMAVALMMLTIMYLQEYANLKTNTAEMLLGTGIVKYDSTGVAVCDSAWQDVWEGAK